MHYLKSFVIKGLSLALILLPKGFAQPPVDFLLPGAPVPQDGFRLTALGTGTPQLKRDQASTGFLLQLGNGDNFIFDMGTGSGVNLAGLGVPFKTLDKVFISHLHSDHIADLPVLVTAGSVYHRTTPLQVYGPSSDSPELGTSAMISGLKQFLAWDVEARKRVNAVGRQDGGNDIVVHEFDYSIPEQQVYSSNGVTIKSTPVQHYNTPGPVAYRLEWNDMVFTFSGDTRPTPTLTQLARGSDLFLVEAVGPVRNITSLPQGYQDTLSWHIMPEQAGAILEEVQPRLGVVFHMNLDDVSLVPLMTPIRSTYPTGELALANDFNAYEVTKDSIALKKWIIPTSHLGWWDEEVPFEIT